MSKTKTGSLIITSFIGGIAFIVSCGGNSISSSVAGGAATVAYVYDAKNTKLGKLFGFSLRSNFDNILTIESDKHYFFHIESRGGASKLTHSKFGMYFEEQNCFGKPYVSYSVLEHTILYNEFTYAKYFYVPPNQLTKTITPSSILTSGGSCLEATESVIVKEVLVNEEGITGFPNEGFTDPVNIRVE